MSSELRHASWPLSDRVLAFTTTRQGGVSESPYGSFNLGAHAGDRDEHVQINRQRLAQQLPDCRSILWLNQRHSTSVIRYGKPLCESGTDAIWTDQADTPCCVLTADCLPVLLCDDAATVVAAVHCGWRGLAGGVLANTIDRLPGQPEQLNAWLGPAISGAAYEVGIDVVKSFLDVSADLELAFSRVNDSHWMADLYELARMMLAFSGVTRVFGGDQCTHSQSDEYYSYRRDGRTGRMASLILIKSSN